MAILQMTVKGQELKIRNPLIVAKTINYIDADISFVNDAWNGLLKFVHFEKPDSKKHYVVDVTDDKVASTEGINLEDGDWLVWIHGQITEEDEVKIRITTDKAKINVKNCGDFNGEMMPSVEPILAEILITEAKTAKEEALKAVEDSRRNADEAKESADVSALSQTNAKESETNAKTSEQNAESYKNQAESYRDDASESARIATVYSNFASSKATEAQKSATNAQTSYEKARGEATKAENSSSFANTSKLDAMGYASKAYEYKEQARQYAESGSSYDDTEIREEVTEVKGEINQLSTSKIDKPSDTPQVGKVLKIKYVNADGSFVCEWAEESGGISLEDIPIGNPNTAGLVKPAGASFGISYSASGNINIASATETDIDARTNNYKPIVPANLEKAVTSVVDIESGTEEQVTFVEEKDLEHYVNDTDYATDGKHGIVRASANYAIMMSSGCPYAQNKTLEQYKALGNGAFVGKGTLENIKENLVRGVVDKPWELISSIVTTEEISKFVVNDVQLKKCQVKMKCPATTGYTSAIAQARYYLVKNTIKMLVARNDSAVNNSIDRYTVFGIAEVENGYWKTGHTYYQSYRGNPMMSTSYPMDSYTTHMAYSEKDHPYVTYVCVEFVSASPIPIGTEIEVWGVRA